MTVKRAFRDHDLRSAFKATFQKFVDKARPAGVRFNQVIRFPGRHAGKAIQRAALHDAAAPIVAIQPASLQPAPLQPTALQPTALVPEASLPTGVPALSLIDRSDEAVAEIVALALDRLAPASMRASSTGTEVEVSVADQRTAAMFRAALDLTTRHRATDRLVRVVVAGRG